MFAEVKINDRYSIKVEIEKSQRGGYNAFYFLYFLNLHEGIIAMERYPTDKLEEIRKHIKRYLSDFEGVGHEVIYNEEEEE